MNKFKLILKKFRDPRKIFGKTTLRGKVITVYINYSPKIDKWRRMLALMHEILHVIDFMKGTYRDHDILHLTSSLALDYVKFGMGDAVEDFRSKYKRDAEFTNSEIKKAISLYNRCRKVFER